MISNLNQQDAIIILASDLGEKVSLIATVPKEQDRDKIKFGDIIKNMALVGGKGGGRPDMARGTATQRISRSITLY